MRLEKKKHIFVLFLKSRKTKKTITITTTIKKIKRITPKKGTAQEWVSLTAANESPAGGPAAGDFLLCSAAPGRGTREEEGKGGAGATAGVSVPAEGQGLQTQGTPKASGYVHFFLLQENESGTLPRIVLSGLPPCLPPAVPVEALLTEGAGYTAHACHSTALGLWQCRSALSIPSPASTATLAFVSLVPTCPSPTPR